MDAIDATLDLNDFAPPQDPIFQKRGPGGGGNAFDETIQLNPVYGQKIDPNNSKMPMDMTVGANDTIGGIVAAMAKEGNQTS